MLREHPSEFEHTWDLNLAVVAPRNPLARILNEEPILQGCLTVEPETLNPKTLKP